MQIPPQFRFGQCDAGARDDACDEASLAITRPLRGDDGAGDLGMMSECRFDFFEFDPVALHFHLCIAAAEEFDFSRRQPASEIAGAVKSRTGVRICDESSVGTLGVCPVAHRYAGAPDVQLARNERRTWTERVIENVKFLSIHRASIGDAPCVRGDFTDLVPDTPDARFRGSTHGNESDVFPQIAGAFRQPCGNPVAAQHRYAQTPARRIGACVEMLGVEMQKRGHGIPNGDALARCEFSPVCGIGGFRAAGQDDGRARCKRPENIPHAQIETERGKREHAILGHESDAPIHVAYRIHRAAMGDHDALWIARAAARIDDVCEIVRAPFCFGNRAGLCASTIYGDGGQALRKADRWVEMRLCQRYFRAAVPEQMLDA